MNKVEYNGWKNYETWCVNLWLTNEQGSSEYWNSEANELFEQANRANHQHWTPSEHARFMLADQLKEWHEENNPLTADGVTASVYVDLIGAALSEVDWAEIANALLEDAETRNGEKYVDMDSEVQP